MPNCSVLDLLFVFNTVVFLWHETQLMSTLKNRIFNTVNVIKLLHFQYLFCTLLEFFWLVLNSNLVNITFLMLLKFNCLFAPICRALLVVFHGLLCFFGVTFNFLCTSAYCFVVVNLSTSTTHFDICWALFLQICHSTIFTVLYYFLFLFSFTVSLCCLFPHLLLSFHTKSESVVSLIFSDTAFCDLCASTLWVQATTYSLLTSLVSFSTISSLIISAVMASSLMLLMN